MQQSIRHGWQQHGCAAGREHFAIYSHPTTATDPCKCSFEKSNASATQKSADWSSLRLTMSNSKPPNDLVQAIIGRRNHIAPLIAAAPNGAVNTFVYFPVGQF